MSKSDAFETALVALIFNATAITGIATNHTSTPITNLYCSLHTADPGETGTQSTNETSYTNYTRTAVARNSGGWTVTANVVTPVSTISFPSCGGGSATITHFGVGSTSTGAGVLYYSGTVSPNIAVSSGVTPQLTTSTTISED